MVVNALKDKLSFETSVVSSKGIVVLDCFATWCGPCKAISPIVEKFSEDAQYKNIRFYKLDVDELEDVAANLGIRAMPTFLFYKDGEKVKEVVGANPKAIQDALNTLV